MGGGYSPDPTTWWRSVRSNQECDCDSLLDLDCIRATFLTWFLHPQKLTGGGYRDINVLLRVVHRECFSRTLEFR